MLNKQKAGNQPPYSALQTEQTCSSGSVLGMGLMTTGRLRGVEIGKLIQIQDAGSTEVDTSGEYLAGQPSLKHRNCSPTQNVRH